MEQRHEGWEPPWAHRRARRSRVRPSCHASAHQGGLRLSTRTSSPLASTPRTAPTQQSLCGLEAANTPSLCDMRGPHTQIPPVVLGHPPSPACGSSTSVLYLQVVQLARLCARHQLGPVDSDAQQRAGRVESATLLQAQRRAVALSDLARLVQRSTVALALLHELQSVCQKAGRGGRGGRRLPCQTASGGKRVGQMGSGPFCTHPNPRL